MHQIYSHAYNANALTAYMWLRESCLHEEYGCHMPDPPRIRHAPHNNRAVYSASPGTKIGAVLVRAGTSLHSFLPADLLDRELWLPSAFEPGSHRAFFLGYFWLLPRHAQISLHQAIGRLVD